MFRRVLLCTALSALPSFAQTTDPLDLARGLRDIGQPDLSLEYLEDLGKKNPAADVKTVLPLEKAKSRLAIAQMESEESAREGGVAQARVEFDAFLKANPKHPRAAEAQLALAQVTAVQAVGQLIRTRKIHDPDAAVARKRRADAAAATRPLFVKASELFGQASKGIAAQLNDSSITAARKRELQRTSLQAELDRGINQYRLVDTYPSNVEGAAVLERANELDKARKIFTDLGKKDDTSPICWQAKAWAGMCEYDKSERTLAEKIFKQVKTDGAKNAAGLDGVRMVEFFEAFIKYDLAVSAAERNKLDITAARALAKNWLDKDHYRPRMTPQRLSMTFYFAYLTEILGEAEVVWETPPKVPVDPKKPPAAEPAVKKPLKIKSISAQGFALLKEAAREYKRLMEFDNEYTDRATDNRSRTIRYIVGDNPKPPKAYTELEECQMAGLIQLMKAREAKEALQKAPDDENAKKLEAEEFAKAIALLERAKQLITPATPPREAADTKLNIAATFYESEQYPLAAVCGEALARSGRGATAARGGLFAVFSYLLARDKQEENADDASKQSDRDRAVAVALYLDRVFPNDPATDSVRLRIGQLFGQEKQYQAAFDILGKISPTFSDIAVARAIQGRAAFLLVAGKDSPLTPQQKAAVFTKAVADCEAVPDPGGGSGQKAYFAVRSLLANLHLSNHAYDTAEKVAAENVAHINASTLEDTEKKALLFSADEVRLRAIYAQGYKLFEEGKYKEMAEKMLPALGEMNKSGPSAVAGLEGEASGAAANLDNFRRSFVVLAMQGRIREGEFDKASELFELLDKLGGSVEATTSALNSLVALVRPQVEALRKEKKAEEADKLSGSIGALLQKQADKPKLSPRVVATLGRSLRDLGQYEKAIEVLKKVPTPTPEKLAAKTAELEEADRDVVIAYQIAQIELARSYRMSKKFDDADKILKAAMGDDKVKGWAKSFEFKKEAIHLLEDKADAAPTKDAKARAWVEAKKGWDAFGGMYAGAIRKEGEPRRPNETEDQYSQRMNDRAKMIPTYLDILCDLRRCLARANSQLLADNPGKLAESLGKLAQQIIDVELANPKSLTAEVKAKYLELLNDFPAMKEEYKKRGGKAFLEGAESAPGGN